MSPPATLFAHFFHFASSLPFLHLPSFHFTSFLLFSFTTFRLLFSLSICLAFNLLFILIIHQSQSHTNRASVITWLQRGAINASYPHALTKEKSEICIRRIVELERQSRERNINQRRNLKLKLTWRWHRLYSLVYSFHFVPLFHSSRDLFQFPLLLFSALSSISLLALFFFLLLHNQQYKIQSQGEWAVQCVIQA